jgi:DNA-binding CsgD family transcriptional regulator
MTSRVIAMRNAGRPNAEIAAEIEVSPARLNVQIGKLVREGAISSRKGLLRSHPDSWVEGRGRTREDVAGKVQRLYKQGKSHKQIAGRLNLTPAQVHLILTNLFAAGRTGTGYPREVSERWLDRPARWRDRVQRQRGTKTHAQARPGDNQRPVRMSSHWGARGAPARAGARVTSLRVRRVRRPVSGHAERRGC